MTMAIQGGELFLDKETKKYMKVNRLFGPILTMDWEYHIYCEMFEDMELMKIVNYETYREVEFHDKFSKRLELVKKETEKEVEEKYQKLRKAIELAKQNDEESIKMLEKYYRKVYEIKIDNNDYYHPNSPLTKEEILQAGIKGLHRGIEEYDENKSKAYDSFLRRTGDYEMIVAIKMSTRKKK